MWREAVRVGSRCAAVLGAAAALSPTLAGAQGAAQEAERTAAKGAERTAAQKAGATADPKPQADAPPPAVELDSLLRLPSGYSADEEGEPRFGGHTRAQWEARFAALRGEIQDSKQALDRAQKKLDETADESSSWQMSAPGSSNPENSPLSFKLRLEIKRKREDIADAERRLRKLEIQADLAGVPSEWRGAGEEG